MGIVHLIQAGVGQNLGIDSSISMVFNWEKGTYPFIVQMGCGLNCNIKSLAAQHPRPMMRAANLRKITGLGSQLLHWLNEEEERCVEEKREEERR